MAVAALVLAALFVLATVTLLAWHSHRTGLDRIARDHLLCRYVVTLKSGEAFDGLLRDADGHTLELVQATSLATGRDPIPVDGSLYVARADVAYLQRP